MFCLGFYIMVLTIKTFFVYKRACKCSKCRRKMNTEEQYFTINNGMYETTKLCKKCWDKTILKAEELYKKNEGKFGEYLKRRMMKKL